MKAADRIRLRHMLEAGVEARAFAQDRRSEDLSSDRMLLLSLVKEIEIIGEAASAVSEELRDATSHIPWAKIKGMRNRLIHAYADVNAGLVWSTVVTDLPVLIRQLEDLLGGQD